MKDYTLESLKKKVQRARETVDFKYDMGGGHALELAERQLKDAEKELQMYLDSLAKKNSRFSNIAEKVVTSATSQWVKEISYGLGVALGNIPAYNSYLGSTLFIDRAISFLKMKRREIILKVGEPEYDELVRAFDELKAAWENVGAADMQVVRANEKLNAVQERFVALTKRTWEWK
jgi:hypothetical protein